MRLGDEGKLVCIIHRETSTRVSTEIAGGKRRKVRMIEELARVLETSCLQKQMEEA